MRAKRILIAALALMMCLPALASCDESKPNKETTPASQETEAQTEDSLTSRKDVKDSLPAGLDFKGREFLVMTQNVYQGDIWVEKTTGDVINDAVYNRNQSVNKRLNVEIVESTHDEYDVLSRQMTQLVLSGDQSYALYCQHMIQAGQDALGDNFIDWYTVPYVDFTARWYPSFAIAGLTVNGKMPLAVGDMLLATIDRTYCVFYDKKMASNLGYSDLYDWALGGDWTLAKMSQIIKIAYQDTNSNGKGDEGDYFGMMLPVSNTPSVFCFCFDIPRVSINEDYEVSLTYPASKMNDMMAAMRDLYHSSATYDGGSEEFAKGTALFSDGIIGDAINVLQKASDFGILPWPKFDENQEHYYTIMGGGVSTMAILKTMTDEDNLEFIGAVTEAMCAESWRSVIPDYYDKALKLQGSRDEQSVMMMDLLLDARAVDFSIAYDGWSGYTYKLGTLLKGSGNWSSYYKSTSSAIKKYYEKVADMFEKLD